MRRYLQNLKTLLAALLAALIPLTAASLEIKGFSTDMDKEQYEGEGVHNGQGQRKGGGRRTASPNVCG